MTIFPLLEFPLAVNIFEVRGRTNDYYDLYGMRELMIAFELYVCSFSYVN